MSPCVLVRMYPQAKMPIPTVVPDSPEGQQVGGAASGA